MSVFELCEVECRPPPGSPTPRGEPTEWLRGGEEGQEGNPEPVGPSDGAPKGTKTFITPCFLQAIKVIPVSFRPCAVFDHFA